MRYPDEVVSYTHEDLLQALAEELGSSAEDPRILDAYDQVVSEWTLTAEDPDAGYASYFWDGPVATRLGLATVQDWAKGRPAVARALRRVTAARRRTRCYQRWTSGRSGQEV